MAKQLLGLIVRDSFQGVMVPIPWRSLFVLKTKVGDSNQVNISGIRVGVSSFRILLEIIPAQVLEPHALSQDTGIPHG